MLYQIYRDLFKDAAAAIKSEFRWNVEVELLAVKATNALWQLEETEYLFHNIKEYNYSSPHDLIAEMISQNMAFVYKHLGEGKERECINEFRAAASYFDFAIENLEALQDQQAHDLIGNMGVRNDSRYF